MKYTRNIFAVSIMALMAVSTARAEVVATTLLDERLGTTGNLATVAATGSYNDLANKPTIPAAANNATLTIQKNGTTVDTFTANASADKTINITVPTSVSQLANDSNFATTTAVDAKVSIAQGMSNNGKGLVVNSSGNLELQDIATQTELNTVSNKIPTNTNQLTNGAGFITSAAISGKEDSTNKVTNVQNFNSDLASTTKYPSMAVAQAIVDQSTETITANVAAAQAAADEANDSISAMTLEGQTGNGVIKTVTQADGKVSATRETIVNADIADETITAAKLTAAVQTSLGKADSALQSVPVATAATLGGVKAGSNITIATDGTISTHAPVTPGNATVTITQGGATKGTFTLNQTGDVTVALTDADTKYTLPAATTTALGGVKSGGNITVATDGTVTVNQAANATSATKATQDGGGNNIVDTYATKAQLNALDSTSTGSGAVVTAVSQTDGKVSVTKGNVQIPVGGASGTTYATIWVE